MSCPCDLLRVKILEEGSVQLPESKPQLSGHAPTSQRAPRSLHAASTEVRRGEGLGSAHGLQGPVSPARAGRCCGWSCGREELPQAFAWGGRGHPGHRKL